MVKDKVIVCFKEGVLWQASAISLFWSEVAEIFYEQQSPLLAVGRPDRQAIKEQKGNKQYMYLYTMYKYMYVRPNLQSGWEHWTIWHKAISTETRSKYTAERRGM